MTKSQRALIKKLKPMGYEPDGYDKRGHLVMRHDQAGFLTLSGTPGDNRDSANTIAEARRRIRFAYSHHGKFLRWLYDYLELQPGETRQFSASLHALIRDYLTASQIDTDTKQLHAIYESVRRYLKCIDRGRRGKVSVWEVSRPAAPVAMKPVKAPSAPAPSVGAPLPPSPSDAPTDALGTPPGTSAGSLPEPLLTALTAALAPQEEHLNRAALASGAIESLIEVLERQHVEVVAELRSILSVLK